MHGTRADLHALDHVDGCHSAEKVVELRLGVHELAIGVAAGARDLGGDREVIVGIRFELALPAGDGGRRQRIEGALQRTHGNRPQPVALLNRLTLLRETQRSVQRFRGRCANQRIYATAAARDAAATGVDDYEVFTVCGEHAGERALGLMSREAGGAWAILLIAVRVADQHALATTARFKMP